MAVYEEYGYTYVFQKLNICRDIIYETFHFTNTTCTINIATYITNNSLKCCTNCGMSNRHNEDLWMQENKRPQIMFVKVNVWCDGIVSIILNAYIFENILPSANYLHFLQNKFVDMLDEFNLET